MLGLATGRKLPGEVHFGFKMLEEIIVGKFSGERDTVVALWPSDVMKMGSYKMGGHFPKPLIMIEQS